MELNAADISRAAALFHREPPLSCTARTIREQADDRRYVIYVETAEGKFVIKLAANGFTTPERVEGWAELIARYGELGCYSPPLRRGLRGGYAQTLELEGVPFVVWEEEHARYLFPDQVEHKALNAAGTRYAYQEEAVAFFAQVGRQGLRNTWGPSGWARLEPFGSDEQTDEIAQCVDSFDALVRDRAPRFVERWERLRAGFERNREALAQVYGQLPASVFQADWNESNLLLDEAGHFQGLIDYNLAGADKVLNMAMSMGLFGLHSLQKAPPDAGPLPGLSPEARAWRIGELLEALRIFGRHYPFCEAEISAAPLLYRYLMTVEYEEIEALEKHWAEEETVALLFDAMEHTLFREDIDFQGAMRA